MLNRFSIAILLAGALLFSNSPESNAQDGDSKSLSPVPDPVFLTSRGSARHVKGRLLLEALEDIERSREAARQTAAEARQEARRLLAFDWDLSIKVGDKGKLQPGSSEFLFQSAAQAHSTGNVEDEAKMRIPKPVLLLAIEIKESPGGSIDSGQGSGHQGLTGDELDLICGPDWIISWLEDENGQMIPGSAELHCGGESYPLPLN